MISKRSATILLIGAAAILLFSGSFTFSVYGSSSTALDLREGNIAVVGPDSYSLAGGPAYGDDVLSNPLALPSTQSLNNADNIDNFPETVYEAWERNGLLLETDSGRVFGVENPGDFEADCTVQGFEGSTDTKVTGPVTVSLKLHGVSTDFAAHHCRVETGTVTCISGDCTFGLSASLTELDRLDRDLLGNIQSGFQVVYDVSVMSETDETEEPEEPPTDSPDEPVDTTPDTVFQQVSSFLEMVWNQVVDLFNSFM